MTTFGYPDPPTAAPRKLRRLSHSPAVPTSYRSRRSEFEEEDARTAATARQGYDDGYADGLARAEAVAAQQREGEARRVAVALAALSQSVAAVEVAERQMRSEIQAAAPKLAFALLEVLLGREVALAENPGRQAITRVLALDDGTQPAIVRLHPGDVEALGPLDLGRAVTVVADQAVEPGGALVEIGRATLDGQLGPALERVRQILLPTDPGADDDRAA
jgi:flagellar assembly protein FliH